MCDCKNWESNLNNNKIELDSNLCDDRLFYEL